MLSRGCVQFMLASKFIKSDMCLKIVNLKKSLADDLCLLLTYLLHK